MNTQKNNATFHLTDHKCDTWQLSPQLCVGVQSSCCRYKKQFLSQKMDADLMIHFKVIEISYRLQFGCDERSLLDMLVTCGIYVKC